MFTVENERSNQCYGCGALVPRVSGAAHKYIGALAGGWAIYGEVLAKEYSEYRILRSAHRLTVDAYAVQHPGNPNPQAIQSVTIHLVGLYLVLQLGNEVMQILSIPFETTDWSRVELTEHKGESGAAYWRTQNFGDIRVRRVEYSPGYLANHWCDKGHIIFCVEGEIETELEDGRTFTIKSGMSYQVGDNAARHRSSTKTGAKLFIVD